MWYDLLAPAYDRSLDALYRPHRAAVAAALGDVRGRLVLDIACGTGQAFEALVEAVGPGGHVVGIDASAGMLKRATARVKAAGWPNVTLARGDAHAFDVSHLRHTSGAEDADGVVACLALTVLDDLEAAFARTFDDLKPGGRYVILDVHNPAPTLRDRVAEWVAQADIRREVWRLLEAATPDFEMRDLDADRVRIGGRLFLASGTKPAAPPPQVPAAEA